MYESDQEDEHLNLPARCFEGLKDQSDCLGIILQFFTGFECVSKFSLVCKKWMEMIQHLPCNIAFRYYYSQKNLQLYYNQFVKSNFFQNVKELEMSGSDCRLVDRIVNCPKNAKLKKLVVRNCRAKGAFAIGKSENVAELTSLVFDDSRIQNAGAIAIVESERLRNLRELDLARCRVSHKFALQLSNSPHMANLTILNLDRNNLKAEGVKYLASSPYLSNITSLNLKRNRIAKEGAQYLSTSQYLTQLTYLNLEGNSIHDDGVSYLCSSSNLTLLVTLTLSGNEISDEGIRMLSNSPNMKNLQSLYLGNSRGNRNFRIRDVKNNYTSSSISIIASSPFLTKLDCLELIDDCLDQNGARLLSEMAPGLSYLLEYFDE